MRKNWILVFALALALPVFAAAQDEPLKLNLGALASRAKETVNISIDKATMGWATQALNSKGGDSAKMQELMKELDGITVQAFEFEKDKAPSVDELLNAAGPVIHELDGPQWKQLVNVTGKKGEGTELVRISLKKDAAGEINGMAILAIEPGEIVLVHVAGKIRLDQIESLGKALGNPGMFGALGGKAAPKPKQ